MFLIVKINPTSYQNKFKIDEQIKAIIEKVNDKTVTNLALKQVGLVNIKYVNALLMTLNEYMPTSQKTAKRQAFNQVFVNYVKPTTTYVKITPKLIGNPQLIKQQANDPTFTSDVNYPMLSDVHNLISAINQKSV